jgi:hypothetical protein
MNGKYEYTEMRFVLEAELTQVYVAMALRNNVFKGQP